MLSDAELVLKVINGQQSCFIELIKRYERAVRAVAVRILHDIHLGEDCAQEVFVKTYHKLGTLRDGSLFGPWVMQIAHREAVSMQRKRKKHDSLETVDQIPAAGRNGMLDDEAKLLLDAVMKLSKHERHIVFLRYFEGKTYRDIAEITGRPVGSVSKQLTRAHGRLRNMLGGLEL
ncbi:MAG: sigma-70 family RNA polymerase sigma factor [Phycisphaerae bacterium]|nr:sigma-70 family RNA polymerase sigma factor [Phycisphaerae bacterium]